MFFSVTKWMLIFLINLAIFCDCFVNGADLPQTTTTIPYLTGCSRCSAFSQSFSSFSIASVKNVSEIDGIKCTQLLSCNPQQGYSDGWIRLTVTYVEGNVRKTVENNIDGIDLEVSCKNGKWYLSDDKEIFNSFDCKNMLPYTPTLKATPKSIVTTTLTPFVRNIFTTSTPRWGNAFTTTSTPALIRTTTPSPYLKINVSEICNNKFGTFQRISANASPFTSRYGSFAGYFKSRSACQKLCKQNYKERCDTYMYEKEKFGKCTIFSYSIHDLIIEYQNSNASIFKRCIKPAKPSGAGYCCGPLVQSPTFANYPDGDMVFTYNNNSCRSKATITCSQPGIQGLDFFAVIAVNRYSYIENGNKNATAEATCSNGIWQKAHPPLNITTLECRLYNFY